MWWCLKLPQTFAQCMHTVAPILITLSHPVLFCNSYSYTESTLPFLCLPVAHTSRVSLSPRSQLRCEVKYNYFSAFIFLLGFISNSPLSFSLIVPHNSFNLCTLSPGGHQHTCSPRTEAVWWLAVRFWLFLYWSRETWRAGYLFAARPCGNPSHSWPAGYVNRWRMHR